MLLGVPPLDVFIVAGEESGDQLGGALMEGLQLITPEGAVFRGIGGRRMAGAGLDSQFPMDDLTAMGFNQVVGKLPLILRRLSETVEAIVKAPPDVLVLVDAPDFTHRVAARVRRRLPDLPIVKYVSPTVWAWRPGRAKAMRPSIDRLLALLPFEPEVHARLGGPPTIYVGHPLLERLDVLRPSVTEQARRDAQPYHLLVLPGSRRSEITRLGSLFGETLGRLAARYELTLTLPTLPRLLPMVEEMVAQWPVPVRIVTSDAEKQAAFRTARAALAASGTVTLELALAGVPTVAAYRVAWWEAKIAPYVLTVTSVVLANLVLKDNVVPEFLQHHGTPDTISAALDRVLTDSPERQRQLSAFKRLDDIFGTEGAAPSLRAAEAVLDLIASRASGE